MSYRDIAPVTPDDGVNVAQGEFAAIWCAGNAGNIVVTTAAGVDRTLPIATGFANRILVRGVRVKATGTTATTLYVCFL